ncbi:ArpU family phage packaging/lysis transcriptional regulator [Enterococcus sp. DIV0086]|uniref:ArpU family phage packaging/lysis transcriptional regulator n=1 Tax=Enterococcus sp. DIV0086 TaxID=2774655 RepID=UPI003D29DC9F
MRLFPDIDTKKTKMNARKVLAQYRKWERIAGKSLIDIRSPHLSDMPRTLGVSVNKTQDGIVERVYAEMERDAILRALASLSIVSRQILHYSFCVQDHYSNYKIAREVGYSERSIQRMKSEALIEFAEAYRNGKIIAYKSKC